MTTTDRASAPLVSVVVPAFNAAPYLGDALDSLLTQTLADIEIVVVDDGSSDDTGEIAERYAQRDPRVRVLRRSTPSGKPACARNQGIRASRGTFIALLDADDIALPTRLEDGVTALRQTNASLAFADFQKFADGAVPATPPRGHLESVQFTIGAAEYLEPVDAAEDSNVFRCRPSFLEYMLTEAIAINVQTAIFSRHVIAPPDIWFNESFTGGEDLDLFFRLAGKVPIAFINRIHTLMRVHPGSLTATRQDRCAEDAAIARWVNFQRVRDTLSPPRMRIAREAISLWFFDIGDTRWNEGQRASARAAFRESWDVRPSLKAARSYFKTFVPQPLLPFVRPLMLVLVGLLGLLGLFFGD